MEWTVGYRISKEGREVRREKRSPLAWLTQRVGPSEAGSGAVPRPPTLSLWSHTFGNTGHTRLSDYSLLPSPSGCVPCGSVSCPHCVLSTVPVTVTQVNSRDGQHKTLAHRMNACGSGQGARGSHRLDSEPPRVRANLVVPVRSSIQKPAVSQVSFVFVFTFCCTL